MPASNITVEGYTEAPTPARIASDERLELSTEEVAGAAEGTYTPPKQQRIVMQTIVNSLAADAEHMVASPDAAVEAIVIPEEADNSPEETATTDEQAEKSEADEPDTESGVGGAESREQFGTSPMKPGYTQHPGYRTAPTATEIAKDNRLELTPEEIAEIAEGEREMTKDEAIVIQNILKRLAEGHPE